MKSITNESLQTFQIFLDYPRGPKSMYLKPKQTVVVPETVISKQVRIMEAHKHLKIREA